MAQPVPAAPSAGTGPLGKPRSAVAVILLSIITLGIYHLYWIYKVFQENKDHTGEGIGGGLALVIAIIFGIVNLFLLPNEVGNMYERAGEEPPVGALTGFWNLIPLVGWIIWTVKVQGAMNSYYEARGATAG